MRRATRVLLTLTGGLLLQGCVSMSQVMASWEGSTVDQLIESWGPPSQVFGDGKGGHVIVYLESSTYTEPAHSSTRTSAQPSSWDGHGRPTSWDVKSETTYTPEQVYTNTSYRLFFVDSDGVITGWKWKGL